MTDAARERLLLGDYVIRAFSEWIQSEGAISRSWVVLGKGPSFERHAKHPRLDSDYVTMGLNHVCRERPVHVTHIIDVDVVREVPNLDALTKFVVMPWYPHIDFKPRDRNLEDLTQELPVLRSLTREGRLLWYNLSTSKKHRDGSPVIQVAYFSAEAAIQLLAVSGVKVVRTLGIDGGAQYAGSFKDIKPFRGGHKTFDHQTRFIQATVEKFGLDFSPLS